MDASKVSRVPAVQKVLTVDRSFIGIHDETNYIVYCFALSDSLRVNFFLR